MTSLDAIAIARGDTAARPDWQRALAKQIGAPVVYYRMRSAMLEGGTIYVHNVDDYQWLKDHKLQELKQNGFKDLKLAKMRLPESKL